MYVYRLTSYETNLSADTYTWHASPIDHGALSTSTAGDTNKSQLQVFSFAGNPFEDWLPINIGPPIELTIIESEVDPETGIIGAKRDILFRGTAAGCTRQGALITVDFKDTQDVAKSEVPDEPITTLCPLKLYDIATCGVVRSEFELSGTIEAIDENNATIDFECAALNGKAASWMIGDKIQTGTKPDLEIRTVEDATILSSTRHRLYLNWPFRLAAVDDVVTGYAGCDRTPGTCASKFDNFDRYGGNIQMPEENLNLKAIPLKANDGGKK